MDATRKIVQRIECTKHNRSTIISVYADEILYKREIREIYRSRHVAQILERYFLLPRNCSRSKATRNDCTTLLTRFIVISAVYAIYSNFDFAHDVLDRYYCP